MVAKEDDDEMVFVDVCAERGADRDVLEDGGAVPHERRGGPSLLPRTARVGACLGEHMAINHCPLKASVSFH